MDGTAVLDRPAQMPAALSALSGPELVNLLEAHEQQLRRLESDSRRLVAELDTRRIAGEFGAASTPDLLTARLRITPAEARARVTRARELQPQVTLTGDVVAPLFPQVSQACAAGLLSTEHARVVSHWMHKLPHWVDAPTLESIESQLVSLGLAHHPGRVASVAAGIVARLDQDGPEPPEPDALRRKRAFDQHRHADGTSTPSGLFSVELTALLDAAVDALGAPRPAPDGTPDPRTPSQRRHDALLDVLRRALLSGDLPPSGGAPVTVLVRTTARDYLQGTGIAVTDRGAPWPVPDVQAASSDALVLPVVTDDHGAVLAIGDGPGGWAPLWQGRACRLGTRAQRLALAARDGGCCFPDCDRPPAWTEVHHVREWQDGGTTDIDNLALLCRYHHRHLAGLGWHLIMDRGLPTWIPPAWHDPARTPVRNQVHHLHEIPVDVARLMPSTG